MILVTGATGTVGRHLIRELAAAGAETRALVRDAQAASSLAEFGVEVVIGSFEDRESLRAALLGVERVFLLSPPGVGSMVEQQLNVLEAARDSGVRQVVKQSSIGAGASTPASIIAAHREIERAIEDSGIEWTHLRPNWFMQNELGQAETITADGVFQAPDVTQVAMIDARDVAAVAARLLTSDGHTAMAYTLTGPQALSYADIAAIYTRLLGRAIRWEAVSLGEARESMVASGVPHELATGFSEIMCRYRDGGVTRQVSPSVDDLLGRAPYTFERFVRDHLDTFRAKAAA